MYERFTDRARKVMQLANQEAQRSYHECIGTEHILLGLIKESFGVAAQVLKKYGVDLAKARPEVSKIILPGSLQTITGGKLPQTPRAKKAIEYAIEEARNLNHNYVGTEHLLLGLLREQEGVAAQVLMNLGLKLEDVRQRIVHILSKHPQSFNCKPACMGGLKYLAWLTRQWVQSHEGLRIFVGGVAATLLGAVVATAACGSYTASAGAIAAGSLYVILQAIGHSRAHHQNGQPSQREAPVTPPLEVALRFSPEEEEKALPILVRHSPGIVLPDKIYVLTAAAVRALQDARISFTVIAKVVPPSLANLQAGKTL